ncbi:MAG: hypothetical protein A2W91_16520 [Bacteroidetes bacterium GWF2_38_335]|nr:MAG: hypothetical protein A2W91_16520 [Bacteroidetes bacterium GWF2_38_335]OFY81293.1 MAG: hypothetical protein A2281_07495 [Bacteroidetes bacterium RIFOXYA12_FULL_38_20]HBS85412.1 hypothetical protein [Bacteroidales bacterium]
MKRKLLHIAIISVLSGLVFACSDSRKEKQMQEDKKEAVAEEAECTEAKYASDSSDIMVTEVLSDDYLRDFENRALQKTQDLASYLEIISDSTIDIYLREQTIEQALEYFDESIRPTAQEVLKNILDFQQPLILSVKELAVDESFIRNSDNSYFGKISFKSKVPLSFFTQGGEKQSQFEVQIILKQVEKDFGGEKELVWEVFLGEVSAKK